MHYAASLVTASLPQALSSTGRCKSFDSTGDGYGRAEGFGVVLLAPPHPGQLAVAAVRGSAMNQDGQSSGLTAPNGPSQTKLLLTSLRRGGLNSMKLRFIAVHGTGTPLGDPIEVGAIGQALQSGRNKTAMLTLGSIKSCYGHTEGAAGITGLLLAAQMASRLCVAPIMHLRNMNPYVEAALGDWQNHSHIAATVPRQKQGGDEAALLAGTSSFGMSGVNAHVTVGSVGVASQHAHAGNIVLKQTFSSRRIWPLPLANPILLSILPKQHQAIFNCTLSHSAVQCNWEHQVEAVAFLPTAATFDLMAAAASCLTEASNAGQALADVILMVPIYCTLESAVTCSILFTSGSFQVAAGTEVSATASMCQVVSPSSSTGIVKAPTGITVAKSMTACATEGPTSCIFTAVVGQLEHCANSHNRCYVYTQAAISLPGLPVPQTVLGCRLYLSAPAPASSLHPRAAIASGQNILLVTNNCPAACQLHGLLLRPLPAVSAKRIATQRQSPAWQLLWRPTEILPVQQRFRPCLILSTHPCYLSSLCEYSSHLQGGDVLLAALNAVWNENSGTANNASSSPTCCSELCLSSEVHLELLLHTLGSQQLCFLVQESGSAVDLSAALVSYRAVARLSTGLRIALITYNQQVVGSLGPSTSSQVAFLQGEYQDIPCKSKRQEEEGLQVMQQWNNEGTVV